MTTTEKASAEFVRITLASGVEVTAERTASPHLVIAPMASPERGVTEEIRLVHTPTGKPVFPSMFESRADLHEIAAAIAHLDWSFTDPQGVSPAVPRALHAARRTVEQRRDQPSENGWTDEHGMPRNAADQARWLLEYADILNSRVHGVGPERIPLEIEDQINPTWTYAAMLHAQTVVSTYLLAALHRIAPDRADRAAAWIADLVEDGSGIGEWAWEWRQQSNRNEPLRLPHIPGPAGDLFGEHRDNATAQHPAATKGAER